MADHYFNNNSSLILDKNETSLNRTSRCGESLSDKAYNTKIRLVTLYVTIIFGTIGGLLVIVWICSKKRFRFRLNRLSRVNCFILNLTVADLLVVGLAVLPQLIWEYQTNREWLAGEFMCKLIKFSQSFSLMASTNMVVAIAFDRHHAITRPLKTPLKVCRVTGAAWFIAALASIPMFFVFRLVDNGSPKCENIFRGKPISHRQAFLTFVTIIVFVIPLIILIVCYTRIFLTIARKTQQRRDVEICRSSSINRGKIQLQMSGSNSLPKAKIKTLKMTFVIVLVFVFCGIPYFIAEMIMSYGSSCMLSSLAYGIMGGLAAANSAANPYVFLSFNISWRKRPSSPGKQEESFAGTHRTLVYTSSRSGSSNTDNKYAYMSVNTGQEKWSKNSLKAH